MKNIEPHPALFDWFYILRQLHLEKGNCVRLSMSGHEGFRVKSVSALRFGERLPAIDRLPPCYTG